MKLSAFGKKAQNRKSQFLFDLRTDDLIKMLCRAVQDHTCNPPVHIILKHPGQQSKHRASHALRIQNQKDRKLKCLCQMISRAFRPCSSQAIVEPHSPLDHRIIILLLPPPVQSAKLLLL